MNDKMETVAEALGDTSGFFQLYTPRDKAVAQSLVGRAEMAGYRSHYRDLGHLGDRIPAARLERLQLSPTAR